MVNVVFNTAFVGDLLLAIPLLKHLQRIHDGDRIVLVCRPGLKDFFLQNELVDEVFELDKKNSKSINACSKYLHGLDIRNLVCSHMSFHSAWILRGIKAQNKISYKKFWNSYFFNFRIQRNKIWPEPIRLLELLRGQDSHLDGILEDLRSSKQQDNIRWRGNVYQWRNNIPVELSMKLKPNIERVNNAINRLGLVKPYVLIAPTSQWATKRWTESGFQQLIQDLANLGKNIYIVGTQSERFFCELLLQGQKSIPPNIKIRNMAGLTSLVDLQDISYGAEVVVCNDSGSMHMAAVAGTPLVAIFGPTTLELGYRPWSDHAMVAQVDEKCRPCGKHGHNKCPLGTHACMKNVKASEVLAMVNTIMRETN